MIINSSEFVVSSSDYRKCPESELPEVALIGRSNVGKSSLINYLVRKKDLAKTSSTPGKTLLINHFLINGKFHLVDLPGYGFAKVSKAEREKLRKMIEGYIIFRPQLHNVFVLVDSRHAPQDIDLDFMRWLGESGVPFSIVFTKADKQSATRLQENVESYKARLLEEWESLPPIFVTSSEKKQGGEEILEYIESFI